MGRQVQKIGASDLQTRDATTRVSSIFGQSEDSDRQQARALGGGPVGCCLRRKPDETRRDTVQMAKERLRGQEAAGGSSRIDAQSVWRRRAGFLFNSLEEQEARRSRKSRTGEQSRASDGQLCSGQQDQLSPVSVATRTPLWNSMTRSRLLQGLRPQMGFRAQQAWDGLCTRQTHDSIGDSIMFLTPIRHNGST